ncbi:hypothetical protein [Corynebacterium sp. 11254D000AR]
MSIFLLAIPKERQREGGSEQRVKQSSEFLRRVFTTYRAVVGNHYGAEPKIVPPGADGLASILTWARDKEPNSVRKKKDWWAYSSGQDVGEDLIHYVSRRGEKLVFTDPLWGSYVAVFGERYRDCVTIWNTVPALETAHYAENEDFVVVSNRPLLAALARVEGVLADVKLSDDYLDEYVLFGYNVSSASPYEKVSTLAVDQALEIRAGRIRIIDAPAGNHSRLDKFHTEEEGGKALASALQDATERAFRDFGGGDVQLRMSGGKDSRILLGLLSNRKLPLYAVTYGRPYDEEVRVAQTLCSLAGTPLHVTAPKEVDLSATSDKVDRIIRLSDGVPPSEPHTALYEGSSPRHDGDPIVLGQWPLMKGGQANKLSYTPQSLKNALRRQATWLAADSLIEGYNQFLEQWASDVAVNQSIEYLYLFARSFRSGRWLQGHINLYERDAVIAYPIADAEVAAVSDALTMSEKVSERALFRALELIWPAGNRVPLSNGGSWLFESRGADEKIGRDSYEQRQSAVPEFVDSKDTYVDERLKTLKPREYTETLARELAAELLESPNLEKLKSKTQPTFWRILEDFSKGAALESPAHSSRREMIKLIWRLYVVDRWMRGLWLNVANGSAES